ncbi:hypothetical protein [Niveispirillum sp. KHB5.9]|uniref:hypothetical protein n=1 Tax=Niveispirillum sp. KHB5.9 TaxID=3400269 RepID=UPI003A837671
MGTVIPFIRQPKPMDSAILLADRLMEATAGLPQLVTAVDSMGRTAESLCHTLQGGLIAMSNAFDQALTMNRAHQRLQHAAQNAIDLAASDPEAAATRLAELRADYARLTATTGHKVG